MKKVTFVVLLIACFVSVAAADEHATSVARPDVVAGGRVAVHPFVNVPATEAASMVIFTSDYEVNAVWWFDTTGKLLGSITGLSNPQGLATDKGSNLYVANTGASNVLVYKKPWNKTPTTLSVSGWYPVAVSPFNDGEYVAVANIFATNGDAGSILIFKKNKLVATIQNSSFYYYYSCAFDAKGNLYVDGRNSSGSAVVGWVPGAAQGKTTLDTLTIHNSIGFPGGVEVNTKNQPAYDDQEADAIYTYKPPVKGSLGSPVDTTDLSGASDAVSFAFTSNGKDVWAVDATKLEVCEYAYPKGGNPVYCFSPQGAALLIGIAVVPAEIP